MKISLAIIALLLFATHLSFSNGKEGSLKRQYYEEYTPVTLAPSPESEEDDYEYWGYEPVQSNPTSNSTSNSNSTSTSNTTSTTTQAPAITPEPTFISTATPTGGPSYNIPSNISLGVGISADVLLNFAFFFGGCADPDAYTKLATGLPLNSVNNEVWAFTLEQCCDFHFLLLSYKLLTCYKMKHGRNILLFLCPLPSLRSSNSAPTLATILSMQI